MNKLIIAVTLLVVFGLGVLVWASGTERGSVSLGEELQAGEVVVYKTPDCGCCDVYAQHLSRSGVNTQAIDISHQEMQAKKDEYGIPQNLLSCHTSMVEGYFVEGHVPLEVIERLLEERPDIAGIALPGMPSGTPGMPGPKREDWVIQAIGHDGVVTEFMRI